jgi:NADH:ubiquinone oxidoreductase subunit H
MFPAILFANSWILLSILEIVLLASSTQVQNSFASLAFIRLIEITVLLEVSVAVIIFCLGITGQFSLIGVASSAEFSCCIVCAIAVFVGIWFERVPFDVIEAESELIDGVTTELGGVVFSMTYACEIVAMLCMLKLFSVIPGITGVVLGTFILLTFVGRIFLARLLLGHVLTLLFTIALGLTQPAFWLLKIYCGQGIFFMKLPTNLTTENG